MEASSSEYTALLSEDTAATTVKSGDKAIKEVAMRGRTIFRKGNSYITRRSGQMRIEYAPMDYR